ncbi:MAG: pyridoxal phosphate-dependent aminotransferase, partial [Janthinobacterium lividum]
YFGKQYNGKVYADAAELSIYLLEEAHVATVGGDSFGDDNCIRLSYAAAEDKLIEAVKRIAAALAKLS